MSRKIRYSGYSFASILTPSQIFGANYFEDWDASQITGINNGDPISSLTSVGLNQGVLNFPLGNEATYLTNRVNGLPSLDFDGSTTYATSDFGNAGAGAYDFLHFGGGAVIMVVNFKQTLGTFGVVNDILSGNDSNRGYVQLYQRILAVDSNGRMLVFNKKSGIGIGNIISRIDESDFWTHTLWQSYVQILDPSNATLNDRMEIFLDGGAGIKGNTDNGSQSLAGTSGTMYVGCRTNVSGFIAAELQRLIFVDAIPTNPSQSNATTRPAYPITRSTRATEAP